MIFTSIVLALFLTAPLDQQASGQRQVPADVFQVIEMPLSITDPTLLQTKNGYLLKCALSNNSEFSVRGLRYSLAVVDSMNAIKAVITIYESPRLSQNQTKSITLRSPIKLKLKADQRVVLMLEQVISTDYLWNVSNAKEALSAYLAGDYSVVPRVVRVSNQVDVPIRQELIY